MDLTTDSAFDVRRPKKDAQPPEQNSASEDSYPSGSQMPNTQTQAPQRYPRLDDVLSDDDDDDEVEISHNQSLLDRRQQKAPPKQRESFTMNTSSPAPFGSQLNKDKPVTTGASPQAEAAQDPQYDTSATQDSQSQERRAPTASKAPAPPTSSQPAQPNSSGSTTEVSSISTGELRKHWVQAHAAARVSVSDKSSGESLPKVQEVSPEQAAAAEQVSKEVDEGRSGAAFVPVVWSQSDVSLSSQSAPQPEEVDELDSDDSPASQPSNKVSLLSWN